MLYSLFDTFVNLAGMVPPKKFIAPLLLIILSLIWGTSFMLIKRGLVVFSANEVGALRVVSAFVFLLPFTLTRLHKLSRTSHVKLFASGLMSILIPSFLFAIAQTRLSSSLTGIMNSLTPIWAIIIGALLGVKRFTKYAVLGTIIGLFGVIILLLASSKGDIGNVNVYALLIITATFLYGSNLNFVKYKMAEMDSLTIASVSTLLIGILATVYLFGGTDFTLKLATEEGALKALSYVVLLGLMSTAIAIVILNRLIKISDPLYASLVTYFIPIVAIIWGALDGEQLSGGAYLGMMAIAGGVYLTNKK